MKNVTKRSSLVQNCQNFKKCSLNFRKLVAIYTDFHRFYFYNEGTIEISAKFSYGWSFREKKSKQCYLKELKRIDTSETQKKVDKI
jgi:hypothetical protein